MVFDEYNRRFASFSRRRNGAMNLYLLDTNANYQAFLKSHNVRGVNTSGIFLIQPTIEGVVVLAGEMKRSEVFGVLQHEGFHQFASNYLGRGLPIWLNEGLAEYFEDGVIVDGRMKLGIASQSRLVVLRDAIRKNRHVPFAQLINMTPGAWAMTLHRNKTKAGVLYDQAWSVVYFLVHGDNGRYRHQFDRYIELLSQRVNPQTAYERAFAGINVDSLAARWKHFVRTTESNPVSLAKLRMQFLGEGLKVLHQHQQPMPSNTEQLEKKLRAIKLQTELTQNGAKIVMKASDDDLYRYESPHGIRSRFMLLEPSRDDLPPRLSAPGLRPEPTLIWVRDAGDKLVYEFEYR